MECSSIFSRSLQLSKAAAALSLMAVSLFAQPANTILLERWDNISGVQVSDLTGNANYPNNPTSRTYPTLYEIPTNAADNYGTRTRGYVTAPTSGNYIFWIAGDDYSELWLGTNDQPSTARLIANVPGWTNSREWTKFSQQQSASIALSAGVRYYIETRHKEGNGGDNLAVGWQLPSGTQERPIPGNRLAPFLLVTAPAITTQPANQTVNQGQTATFNVVASGTAPLTYQWRRNGSTIPGATTASYTTPATTSVDNGAQFSVVVSNGAGSVTSANAVLTVNVPPTITTQPQSQTLNVGQPVTFTVVASGTAPLSYQWRLNGNTIPGATSATLSFPSVTLADNGSQFSVVVTNMAGSVTSAAATLTIISAPVISAHPQSQTVTQGQAVTFSVVASGSNPLSYQWRLNGNPIPGANSPSYLVPAATSADNGSQFSVVISNAFGSVTSNAATLTVLIPPTITTQPATVTVSQGQTATFSVTATGTSPISYQWRRNGNVIPGATSASFTTSPAALADNGTVFTVVVTNTAGSVTSAPATWNVIFVPTNQHKIAVSGELFDASGNPVGNPTPVTVDVIVRLFNAATDGIEVYTEEFRTAANQGITVRNGLFVARLGEGATTHVLQQTLAVNTNLWVEITVDDGTPDVLLPRTPLTASAYALGGSPAPAAVPSLAGSGDPNVAGTPGEVGAIYVNSQDNSTWIRLKTTWKRMD